MREKYKFLLLTGIALVLSLALVNRFAQVITILSLAAGGVWFISKRVEPEMVGGMITLFLSTFFIHTIFSLFIYNTTVGTIYYGFSYRGDDYVYGDFGMIVGDLWRNAIFPSLAELKRYNLIGENIDADPYQIYSAIIFFLLGARGGQVLLIVNCFFHAAIIISAYFISKELGMRRQVINFLLALFVLWPSVFYWSSFNFKEPAILFSLFAIFSLILKIRRKAGLADLFFITVFLAVLFLLRRYLFFGIMTMLTIYFVIFSRWRYKKQAILAALVLLIIKHSFFGPILPHLYMDIEPIPSKIYAIREAGASSSNTAYFTGLVTRNWERMMMYMPLGILSSLFLPFLLRPSSLWLVFVNVESIIWWSLLPFLFGGIYIAIRKKAALTFPVVFIFFYWFLILALSEGNMGTLLRHKAALYYMGFVFIGLAVNEALDKHER